MGEIYFATSEAERALSAATARTVIQLKGATTTKAKVTAWGISFDGISATDAPVVVRFLRQTSAGTSSGLTEVKRDPDGIAAAVTAFSNFSSTEPTASDVFETHEIHPQGGNIVREYPPGREPILAASASAYIGVECNAPAAVNAVAWFQWEE